MSREKNCKWHFDDNTGVEEGPNSALEITFKKTPYSSLIRESIQNSLDAVLNADDPVRITVEMKEIKIADFPSFLDLKKHIQGCIDHYPENENAKSKYQKMLDRIGESQSVSNFGFVKITDANTKGMPYEKGKTNSPFYAFVRSRGVSAKDNLASGGSYGFGKAAYFNMSPIRTMFISTLLPNGNSFFEGVSSLCTHDYTDENGVKLKKTSVGFYDDNNGQPTTNIEAIPVPFKVYEPGTAVSIVGFDLSEKEQAIREMQEAVLQNFWMSIWAEKLSVTIGGILINKDTLQEKMEEFFTVDTDNNTKEYNPRPYFDAVRLADSGMTRYKYIKRSIEKLGEVELYVNINKAATIDKVSFMRAPLMLISADKNRGTNYGFNAIFICRGEVGNRLLRKVENPAHTEWRSDNADDSITKQEAKEIVDSVKRFIREATEELFMSDDNTSLQITGLEEYLYVPEDLVSDEDNDIHIAQHPSIIGRPTGQYMDDGGSITNVIAPPKPKFEPEKERQIGHVIVSHGGAAKADPQGDEEVGTVGNHNGKGPKPSGPKPGSDFKRSNVDKEGEGSYFKYIPVTFRVVAQMEDGKMFHNIIFHSDVATDNGEIELVVGGEQKNEIMEIAEVATKPSGIRDNFITHLNVNEGKNIVKVRFADNMKHAIILKAYERR